MMPLFRQCRAVLRVTQLSPRALLRSSLVLATGLVAVTAATDLFARPFIPTPSLQAGDGPSRIVAGDFNGDGRGDLAVANQDDADGTERVGLLLGEGAGLFRYAGTVFDSGQSDATALFSGDFNQDGKPDLLLETGCCGYGATVLLGQGNGTFVAMPGFGLSGPAFLADGNADGRPDLIVQSGSGASSRLQVWLGALNGTFSSLAAFTAPAGVDFSKRPLAVGDLNGDRIADVAATNSAGTATVVLRGAANGSYAVVQTLATGTPKLMANIADFTGDGAADLVVEKDTADSYIVLQAYRGHGDGTFDASPFWSTPVGTTYSGRQWITDLSSGDLNGDGARDFAGVSLEGVQVFLGGSTSFTSWGTFAVGLNPIQTLFGDLDGAGARDIAVVHAKAVTLVLAAPDGSYRPQALPQSENPSPVPRIAAGDFNGDGRVDVAALHSQVSCEDLTCPWGEVEAWPALAQGGFGAPGLYPIGVAPVDLLAVDLDRDGRLDLVAANEGDGPNPPSLSLLRGRGDGTFEAEVLVPLTLQPGAVTAGDLDRDGDIDLALANFSDGTITVLLRTPAGGYAAQPALSAGRIPIRIEAVDLDGDGILDLAVADQGQWEPAVIPGDVRWFRGRGNGTFDPSVVLISGFARASDLAVADLDADGDPDLVVTDEWTYTHELGSLYGGGFSVLRNQGPGAFAATFYPSLTFPLHARVADLNGDGSVDLLIENGSGDLGLYPGVGDGTFGPAERFSVWGCRNFELVRLAGDGDVDLLTSCGNVSRIENEATPANPGLLFLDASRLGWDPVDLVTGYDVIRGSLPLLRASGGNFGLAVQACVQNDGAFHTVDLTSPIPPVGGGFFYLVRAIGWNGTPGSYDGELGQAHPRDASIQSSAVACP
ncbi:MAG TPA: VCBS repeat-containing protein [Candidatus Polarisedimenticolia bacterium]|nr:VCBS repeat-containing protein [Candidatus Polarisedimenticolia bacterium]